MPSLILGTAGHIDHGKSALVRALTGIDPDRLKEEKARGITIDLGFAHATIGEAQIAFVDVPGHERFVRNMLAGAGGIDAVLLVVAANESVKPQTREHLDICRLLGIAGGLIVLTKTDLADATALERAALDVRELVVGSFLESAPVIAVSSRTGEGLDALRAGLRALAGGARRPARAEIVRLPVDRAFSVKGFGTVVTGTLVSGTIREGDELTVLPDGRAVRVRGIQVHGRAVASVSATSRAALNLGSIEVADLARGRTLATAGGLAVTRRVDVRLQLVPGEKPLAHGAPVRVHHGTDGLLGRVALSALRSGEADWVPVRVGERGAAAPAGGEAYARLRLERPMVLTRGDRVVIRAYSPPRTIGGGLVLDPEPPRGGVRRAGELERFQRIDVAGVPATASAPDAPFIRCWLEEAAAHGLVAADLVRRGGQDPAAAAALIDALARGGDVLAGERLFCASVARRLDERVRQAVEQFHHEHPHERGMSREALRDRVAHGAPAQLFDAVVSDLARRQILVGSDRLSLRARTAAGDPKVTQAREAIETCFRAGGLTPPDPAAIPSTVQLASETVVSIVHVLVKEQRLVRVGGFVFHADALEKLRRDVKALKPSDAQTAVELDVATFKSRYGLTRKFAIPLLEWLDRSRVTRRVGERRIVL